MIEVKQVKRSALKPAPYNPRTIDADSLARLQRGIEHFGLVDPIIAKKDGLVIGGHQRLKVAETLGLETVPVVYVDVDDQDAAALNVLLNNPDAQGAWDMPKLTELLSELDANGYDATLTGFTDDGLKDLLGADPKGADPDQVPDVPDDPVSVVGEVYELGRHRVMCGDSTDRMPIDGMVDVCLTDPPYSVEYDRSQKERGGSSAHVGYAEHGRDPHPVLAFVATIPANVLVMTYPIDRHFHALAAVFAQTGWDIKKELVWVKDQFSFWPGAKYQQQHEPILVCTKDGAPIGGNIPANASTVFEIPRAKAHQNHPTARPMELWSKLVEYHVPKGGNVYDPFLGSGTTLIAAEQLGRTCYGMEIEPKYVDVIRQRYADYTGKVKYSPRGVLSG